MPASSARDCLGNGVLPFKLPKYHAPDENYPRPLFSPAMEANGDIESAKNAAEQARLDFDYRAATEFYRKTLEMAEKSAKSDRVGGGVIKNLSENPDTAIDEVREC